jgi:hypothetical protein
VNVNLLLVLLALGASAASALMTWSLLRRERERGAARIAALTAAIDPTSDTQPGADLASLMPVHMFAATDAPVEGGGKIRLTVIAAMAVIALIALASQYRSASREASTVAAVAATAPLELMSMRHVQDGGAFTIRGLVRNPRESRPVSGLIAVVLAFDRQGMFLTSARAPIDFTTLEPGDESPFAVRLPATGDVARYRVTFRTESGVLRHVDRREAGVSLAVNRH